MRRVSLLLVTALLAALVTVSTGTTPAQAHAVCVHHGDDFGCSHDGHNRWSACDQEYDGHYVYTEVYVAEVTFTVRDPNGADAGCGVRYEPGIYYRMIRVCEDTPGYPDWCTPWRYA
jgi:hypothetical protein